MILEAADTHLGGQEPPDVLPVLPIPESHGVRGVVREVRMELQP